MRQTAHQPSLLAGSQICLPAHCTKVLSTDKDSVQRQRSKSGQLIPYIIAVKYHYFGVTFVIEIFSQSLFAPVESTSTVFGCVCMSMMAGFLGRQLWLSESVAQYVWYVHRQLGIQIGRRGCVNQYICLQMAVFLGIYPWLCESARARP